MSYTTQKYSFTALFFSVPLVSTTVPFHPLHSADFMPSSFSFGFEHSSLFLLKYVYSLLIFASQSWNHYSLITMFSSICSLLFCRFSFEGNSIPHFCFVFICLSFFLNFSFRTHILPKIFLLLSITFFCHILFSISTMYLVVSNIKSVQAAFLRVTLSSYPYYPLLSLCVQVFSCLVSEPIGYIPLASPPFC